MCLFFKILLSLALPFRCLSVYVLVFISISCNVICLSLYWMLRFKIIQSHGNRVVINLTPYMGVKKSHFIRLSHSLEYNILRITFFNPSTKCLLSLFFKVYEQKKIASWKGGNEVQYIYIFFLDWKWSATLAYNNFLVCNLIHGIDRYEIKKGNVKHYSLQTGIYCYI